MASEPMTGPAAASSRAVTALLLLVYIGGFAHGTFAHVTDVIQGGLLPYREYPLAVNVFWTTLMVVDPLVILALLLSLRIGVILAVTAIIPIVAVSVGVSVIECSGAASCDILGPTINAAFALFVLAVAPRLWRAAKGWRSPFSALRAE